MDTYTLNSVHCCRYPFATASNILITSFWAFALFSKQWERSEVLTGVGTQVSGDCHECGLVSTEGMGTFV